MGDIRRKLFDELADFENSKCLSDDDKQLLRLKRDALFKLAMKRGANYVGKHLEGKPPEERVALVPITLKFTHELFHPGSSLGVPGGAVASDYDSGASDELDILGREWPCI